ncbi:MAG TPA: hypothetical protein VFO20_06345 [Propionibacteriaceae bacterium]|nr:hypothetical protein [Propionibacteriaceae bacterium]
MPSRATSTAAWRPARPILAAAAQAADLTENTLYLDPLLKGRYPDLSKLDSKLAAGLRAAVRMALGTAVSQPSTMAGSNCWSNISGQCWGLVRVDFNTLQRTPKSSASWYSRVASGNQLPPK